MAPLMRHKYAIGTESWFWIDVPICCYLMSVFIGICSILAAAFTPLVTTLQSLPSSSRHSKILAADMPAKRQSAKYLKLSLLYRDWTPTPPAVFSKITDLLLILAELLLEPDRLAFCTQSKSEVRDCSRSSEMKLPFCFGDKNPSRWRIKQKASYVQCFLTFQSAAIWFPSIPLL